MKIHCLLIMIVLFGGLGFSQKPEDVKKQQEKDRKRQEKIEKELRAQRLATPVLEYFPANANLTGQCLTKTAMLSGFTFAGYQPAGQVFGAQTAQVAIFTRPLSFGESFATGVNIGLAGARSLSEPVKYIAFVVNETNAQSSAVEAKIGIASLTTAGWYYSDLSSVEKQRQVLESIVLNAKAMAGTLSVNQSETVGSAVQQYQRIKIGMTIDEVVGVLGKGVLLSESESATSKIAEYEWVIGEGKISATFEDNRLIKKSQVGVRDSTASLVSHPEDDITVFWVPGSLFYHTNESCPRKEVKAVACPKTKAKSSGAHPCSGCDKH